MSPASRRSATTGGIPAGSMAPLHALNPVRIGWLRDLAIRHFDRPREDDRPLPLAGLDGARYRWPRRSCPSRSPGWSRCLPLRRPRGFCTRSGDTSATLKCTTKPHRRPARSLAESPRRIFPLQPNSPMEYEPKYATPPTHIPVYLPSAPKLLPILLPSKEVSPQGNRRRNEVA